MDGYGPYDAQGGHEGYYPGGLEGHYPGGQENYYPGGPEEHYPGPEVVFLPGRNVEGYYPGQEEGLYPGGHVGGYLIDPGVDNDRLGATPLSDWPQINGELIPLSERRRLGLGAMGDPQPRPPPQPGRIPRQPQPQGYHPGYDGYDDNGDGYDIDYGGGWDQVNVGHPGGSNISITNHGSMNVSGLGAAISGEVSSIVRDALGAFGL